MHSLALVLESQGSLLCFGPPQPKFLQLPFDVAKSAPGQSHGFLVVGDQLLPCLQCRLGRGQDTLQPLDLRFGIPGTVLQLFPSLPELDLQRI